jgi:hypothetical protein
MRLAKALRSGQASTYDEQRLAVTGAGPLLCVGDAARMSRPGPPSDVWHLEPGIRSQNRVGGVVVKPSLPVAVSTR